MKKQAFNPFLPLDEYIPDGEPHVFGERLYLFGSHDSEGGARYCAEGNYVGWSAPLKDPCDWRFEGEIYNAKQDPRATDGNTDLYAPDVVQGCDGQYYLYYGLSGPAGEAHVTPIGVAVCDKPCGRYEYLGFVRNPDGSPFLRYLPADPAVLNDNGVIRLYYGWSLSMVAAAAHGGEAGAAQMEAMKKLDPSILRQQILGAEMMLFKRTREELESYPDGIMGANTVELCDDMLTVRGDARRIVPGQFSAFGTGFEGHAFYEAASIRRINGIYYFIYSDENSNALCYATSRHPDRDFEFGGVIISNGDVGYMGRKPEDRLNMTANNHGSLVEINKQWYIFYHRHTHNTTFSRQACAEPVTILPDGSIPQVECSSCGLNGGPLLATLEYPAAIACNITNGSMPHATNRIVNEDIPFITHDDTCRYITNIHDGTMIVYKLFQFDGPVMLTVTTRGDGGSFKISIGEVAIGAITVKESAHWTEHSAAIGAPTGTHALALTYFGAGTVDLLSFRFNPSA